jgi:chain length determinant protein EpsF
MTLGQLWSILKARKWSALLMLAIVVGVAIALSLSLPKRYTATSTLMIDLRPDPVTQQMVGGGALPAYIATQVDVMYSDRVVERAVRNLKLAEVPDWREAWQKATSGEGRIEAWIGEGFRKGMDIQPSKESNLISVAYTADDPDFAASAANAVVKAFLDTHLDLRIDPAKQNTAFFDSRAKELRAEVERAQARVAAFQRERGIVATDERLDFETQQLNQLSAQLTMLQTLSAESTSRQAQASGGSADRLQEVINNPMLAGMRADLTRAEARLQELNARLGDNHPQVVEAKANISSLRGRLEAETRRVTGSVGVANTINRAREGEIRAALEAQRAKVLRIKAARDEGAVLYRDVENAQRAYDAVVLRFSQTNLESQATQSNIHQLSPASAPRLPSSPNIKLNAILALVLGSALAMGTAVLLEMSDRRLRTVEEVPQLLDLPALGVLLKPGAMRMAGVSTAALLVGHRRLRQLPPPVGSA